jgi:DNA-binding NarL/FixJ family response regulator
MIPGTGDRRESPVRRIVATTREAHTGEHRGSGAERSDGGGAVDGSVVGGEHLAGDAPDCVATAAAGPRDTANVADVRVLVGEDHPLMLEAIVGRLEREPGIEVVGSVTDGASVVEKWAELQPDVVLVDHHMPGMTGIDAAREITTRDPDARVLVLSAFDEPALVVAALRAGATGYLVKSIPGSEIADAVRAAARGELLLGPSGTKAIVSEVRNPGAATPTDQRLSPREAEVLGLVSLGLTNAETARQLHVSSETVKTHLERVFNKLGVGDRASAVRRAMELGYLP